MKTVLIVLIRGYQWLLSPLINLFGGGAPICRFQPTCSRYAIEALEVYQGVNVPLEYSHSCGVVLIWLRQPGREEFRGR